MTSQPEVPGAAAVYLFREEDTEDDQNTVTRYVRLKVLTEKGKEYGDVELQQFEGWEERGYTIYDIQGRTIHADGTVIPFTGKAKETLVEARPGEKVTSKVFALPDVQVGSIIEYRYKLGYSGGVLYPPSWYIQTELFTRKAHYLWRPTIQPTLTNDGYGQKLVSGVAWTPLLPKNAVFTHSSVGGFGQLVMELKVDNVAPIAEEEDMPPIRSRSYRLLFYYTPYRSGDEFWLQMGKGWSKASNTFIGPGSGVKDAVSKLVSPSDTDDQKLRKIYAAVMQLTNLTYTRELTSAERQTQKIKTTDDIWTRKAGDANDLTNLFVAMARAAGMKAYLMLIADRSQRVFLPSYLEISQLHDDIAIVQVGGKEVSFDPGQRYTPYGHLAWPHEGTSGLRQTDAGTQLVDTPMESYKDSRMQRIADLKVDREGLASGTVTLTQTGAPAEHLRYTLLVGDNLSLQRELASQIEGLLPKGMTATIGGIEKMAEYEEPLVVRYDVTGKLGTTTGKRLILPADIFEAQTQTKFTPEKRETPVFFHYPYQVADAVRVSYPPEWNVESVPPSVTVPFKNFAAYSTSSVKSPGSLTVRRDFTMAMTVYAPVEYPGLREFYRKVQTNDQEPIVLAAGTAKAGD